MIFSHIAVHSNNPQHLKWCRKQWLKFFPLKCRTGYLDRSVTLQFLIVFSVFFVMLFPNNANHMMSYFCVYSIGYPVVTLGFGFKSYVSYKMRLRKQKEVQKENEFYMQLLQQALPPEQQLIQRQEREAEEGKDFALCLLTAIIPPTICWYLETCCIVSTKLFIGHGYQAPKRSEKDFSLLS